MNYPHCTFSLPLIEISLLTEEKGIIKKVQNRSNLPVQELGSLIPVIVPHLLFHLLSQA